MKTAAAASRLVYFIEGDRVFNRLLTALFYDLDGFLLEALNPDHMATALEEKAPDLIIILEDAELYDRIRQWPRVRNVPILFVAVDEPDVNGAPELVNGDRAWLLKNDPQDLLGLLNEIFPGRNAKKILSVDDSPTVLKQIRQAFFGTPYVLFQADNGRNGLEMLEEVKPDLVLTDVEMPVMDGLEFCRMVRSRPDTADVPIIILSSRVDYDTIASGFESGADEYLTKPFFPDELLNKAESYLVPPPARRKEHILVISAAHNVTHQLRISLDNQGFDVTTAAHPIEAMDIAQEEAPDLVIADMDLPEMTGIQFCTQIRSLPQTKRIPFMLMTEKTSTGARKMGKKVGVSAYLTKPFTREGLLTLAERLLAENRSLQALEWDMVLASITSLARALDERDAYTRFHSENVSRYAVAIARKAGMNAAELENIRLAGLLHDIGKIGIPDMVLHKPGRLTEEEFEKIKQHSRLGAEILQPIPALEDVVPGILHHHERMDGKGYPHGLQGRAIPVFAQILAVADTYDALVTDRPYRAGMPRDKAVNILNEVSGPQLSPPFVRLFLDWLAESE